MTVAELIKKLQAFPADAIVVTDGYETGLEPVKKVEVIRISENHLREWWDGTYEKSENPDDMVAIYLNAEIRQSS